MIIPVFAVIPIGWTHSLAVCQDVLEGLARQVPGIDATNALVDKRVAPDNFESFAYRQEIVRDAATSVEGKINDAGLPTHPVAVKCGGDSLGWQFLPRHAS